MSLSQVFLELLHRSSAELHEDNRDRMHTGKLLPTKNVISSNDASLFFQGVELGLLELRRGGRFNTLDRPTPAGRWGLLSRSRDGSGTTPSTYRSSPPTLMPSLTSATPASVSCSSCRRTHCSWTLRSWTTTRRCSSLVRPSERHRHSPAFGTACSAASQRPRPAQRPRSAATSNDSSAGECGRFNLSSRG